MEIKAPAAERKQAALWDNTFYWFVSIAVFQRFSLRPAWSRCPRFASVLWTPA